LVLVQEYEETQLACAKQHHLTLPVDRQVTSILGLVACPQQRWQPITMAEPGPHSSHPTIKQGAPRSMELRLRLRPRLLSMALQAVSSSKM
jgi:hypothetical protein